MKEPVFIETLRMRIHCWNPLDNNPKEAELGMVLIYCISCYLVKQFESRNFHRLSALLKLHNTSQDYYTRILTLMRSQELSIILVLKAV